MKHSAVAAAILGMFAILAGCAGLSSAEIKAYLDGIPVTTPDISAKPDGVYEGSYTLAMPRGGIAAYHSVSVEVTVKAGHIDSISVTKPKQLSRGRVYDSIVTGPAGVIAKQSLDVDAVSGASYSSKTLLKAVEDALSR
jgi:uncharacterized protein with FMN-binding domain